MGYNNFNINEIFVILHWGVANKFSVVNSVKARLKTMIMVARPLLLLEVVVFY